MRRPELKLWEITLYPILGGIMVASKILLDALPNIHLLGVLVMVYTIVFRKKALIPIYIYVFVYGAIWGFSVWWIPNLYIWTVLMLVCRLLPKTLSGKRAVVVYSLVCGLHGLFYGCLYAPAQALFFGLDFKGMLLWIAAGIPFDVIHGVSNLLLGILIVPLSSALKKAIGQIEKQEE